MKYILAILILLCTFTTRASHIVGGDIYYDHLGGSSYRFYISVYRDCNSTGAAFDDPLNLAVYIQGGNLYQNIQVPFPGSVPVPVVFNNPCVTPPNNICTENALYTVVIDLPPIPQGYTVTYQRCCRGPNITNLINPDDTGFTLTCDVPGSANNDYINSSPRFTNYPPQLLCNNDDLIFDHSATDPDGDQLVYSLVTPYNGGSSITPQPNPAQAPPYFPVQWAAGYSAPSPLGPGSSINIDPNTGLLTADPDLTGLFVVGIQVQEIRNGVIINQTIRDFLFRVFNCNLQLESLLPTQDQLPGFIDYCQGLTVDFVNDSYGGTNYFWDFGVAGITTDVSTDFEPSYTFPAPGYYQVMLVVNPGWPCTDTAYMDIHVNDPMVVNFTSEDSLCIFDNNFNFVAATNGPAGTNFNWTFGPNANQPTGTGQTVNNINFDVTGHIPVTVVADYNLCVATYTDSVYILPEPVAEMILPADIECEGLTIAFGNNSQNAGTTFWDFGVLPITSDTTSQFAPTYTYPGPGTYTVTLIASSSNACSDTAQQEITLNHPLVVSFTSEDSLCFKDNLFNFDGTVSGPVGSVYTWNFGPFASIQTSNDIDVPNVTFSTTGTIPITLTGTFEECVESLTQEIYIFQEPSIAFGIQPGLQCVPFEAHFIDSSFAETQIYYQWDFGDGFGSTDANPVHTYTQVGNYNVQLVIRTDAGCIDTLTLMKPDLVNVRPNPVAGFTVDPDYTDICNSHIQFTDASSGANQWFYWYDDGTAFSMDQNPVHTYLEDGRHYPYQIVTNEFGCKDTARSELYIEPFTVYAPNTFTPDGDEFNNTFLPIVYLPVERWKLQIFNRWGELIFETLDVNQAWDGSMNGGSFTKSATSTNSNGNLVQDGTYLWKLTFVSCEPINPERIVTGHVTLIK